MEILIKRYIKQAIAFLYVWFCSGITMYAYQTGHEILGLIFTFFGFLYWFFIDKGG